MHRRCLALCCLLTAVSCLYGQTKPFILIGQIEGATAAEVAVSFYPTPVHPEPTRVASEVDAQGRFSLEIPLERPRKLRLTLEKESATLFGFPGDKLSVAVNLESFDESLTYEGGRASAAASQFLARWFLEQQDRPAREAHSQALQSAQSLEELQAYLARKHEAEQEFWQAQQEQNEYPPAFVQHFERSLHYQQLNDRLTGPMYVAYYQQKDLDELHQDDAYFAFLTDIELNDEAAMYQKTYVLFLDRYFDRWVNQQEESAENPIAAKLELARERLERPVADLFQAQVIKSVLAYGDPVQVQPYYEELMSGEGAAYARALTPMYERAMRLAPGEPAPNFVLKNAAGEEVSLEDLRGNVLYVDFWASWCQPCRAEMPSSRELIEQYQGEAVTFVFISLDKDEDAWRKAMAVENLEGVHLYSPGFGSETAEAYNVQAIPNYFIIDPAGKIADPFPPRPSHEGVRQAIGQALQGADRKTMPLGKGRP